MRRAGAFYKPRQNERHGGGAKLSARPATLSIEFMADLHSARLLCSADASPQPQQTQERAAKAKGRGFRRRRGRRGKRSIICAVRRSEVRGRQRISQSVLRRKRGDGQRIQ